MRPFLQSANDQGLPDQSRNRPPGHGKRNKGQALLQGLPDHSLVIGLKGKEREIKKVGNFFSFMSWDLREYSVVTEYLMKTQYVPLFHGLTMADDLKAVIRKIQHQKTTPENTPCQAPAASSFKKTCAFGFAVYQFDEMNVFFFTIYKCSWSCASALHQTYLTREEAELCLKTGRCTF